MPNGILAILVKTDLDLVLEEEDDVILGVPVHAYDPLLVAQLVQGPPGYCRHNVHSERQGLFDATPYYQNM